MRQSVFFGENKIQNLKIHLEKFTGQKIFLITDNDSYHICGAEGIIEPFLKKFTVTRFSDFAKNPQIEDVKNGINIFRKNQHDLVIAVGGGSVIDMAKLINILSPQDDECENIIYKESEIKVKGKPLICIPTTAGTGSEATHFAVVYINKNKYSLAHPYILPDIVIIDPIFTYNIPPYLTAVTGLDALSQAIESYWNIHSNDESKRYAKNAIELIMRYLPEAVDNHSKEARIELSRAAHDAGRAINITQTTAPHAVSYPFTSYFEIPHGHAVFLTLPYFLEYNYHVTNNDLNDKRGIRYVQSTILELCGIIGFKTVEDGKKGLMNFAKELNVSLNIKRLGIRNNKDIEIILKNLNAERMSNNPRAVTSEFIRRILIRMMID